MDIYKCVFGGVGEAIIIIIMAYKRVLCMNLF